MKGFLSIFQESAKEFGKIRTLTVTAVLIALYFVLLMISINVGAYLKINFAFLALAMIGMFFGPCVAVFAGAICDVISFLVNPSDGFLIIFTLITMFCGLIYGLLLYKKQGKNLIISGVIAVFLITVICHLVLNTFALVHYGLIPSNIIKQTMLVRVIKNVIEFPVDCVLMSTVLPAALVIYNRTFKRNKA